MIGPAFETTNDVVRAAIIAVGAAQAHKVYLGTSLREAHRKGESKRVDELFYQSMLTDHCLRTLSAMTAYAG